MFAGSFVGSSARPRSRWTLLGSLAAHLVILIALVVLPLMAATDTLVAPRQVIEFVPAPPPPPIPAIKPPVQHRTVAPPINPNAAPPESGTTIAPETELPPATPGIPDAGFPVTSGRAPDGLIGRSVATLSAPPPQNTQPVPVGGQIRAPRRITYVPPVYPTIAQTARVEGDVIVEALIDETGVVRNVRVLRSIPLLDRAAVDAVSRWRYSPTTLNNQTVPVIMTVTVSFKLR
jgi:protein TonB